MIMMQYHAVMARAQIAYLHPVNPDDPSEGSFDLNTAFILERKAQQE
jgi:hypothetical protein